MLISAVLQRDSVTYTFFFIFFSFMVYHGIVNIVPCAIQSVQFSCSVVSDSCDPMDCSMPGLPVLHQLPEFTQTHVHRVSDTIQPSHPLSPLLLPPSIFLSIRVFSNESVLRIRWPNYWSFSFSISPSNEYSGLISFRMDWFTIGPCCLTILYTQAYTELNWTEAYIS